MKNFHLYRQRAELQRLQRTDISRIHNSISLEIPDIWVPDAAIFQLLIGVGGTRILIAQEPISWKIHLDAYCWDSSSSLSMSLVFWKLFSQRLAPKLSRFRRSADLVANVCKNNVGGMVTFD